MKLSAKAILVPAIALFIIATLVAAALAGTNLLTADKIEQVNIEAQQASYYTVLGIAADEGMFGEEKIIKVEDGGTEYDVLMSECMVNGESYGFAFVAPGPGGYGGTLNIVIGTDPSGKITGVYTLDIANETPGLGQNASGAFKDQFVGLTCDQEVVQVTKDGGTIDAMSGATITSRAVSKAVTYAMKAFNSMKGVS